MPYIDERRRYELDHIGRAVISGGELTYLFTRAALDTYDDTSFSQKIKEAIDRYIPKKGAKYDQYVIVVGSLHNTAKELQRRNNTSRTWNAIWRLQRYADRYYNEVIVPYEDEKIDQNGDIEGLGAKHEIAQAG